MEKVQFEEGLESNSYNSNRAPKTGSLTRFFIKLGLAKDQKQANVVMLILSFTCLFIMFYFLISTFYPNLLDFSKPKPVESKPFFQIKSETSNDNIESEPNK